MDPKNRNADLDGLDAPLDPDAPASAGEVAAAEALRAALDDPSRDHEGAALLRAVAEASAPRPLDDAAHRAIVERALSASPAARTRVRPRSRAWPAATFAAIAIAAALVLVLGERDDRPRARALALTPARSTQPLFSEPFARHGGESARIDRIASARASDLRDNRFALRGVR
jgi:hypothetical protein